MMRLQRALLSWYRRNGRNQLPWRQTRDPYRILVSEFMLQQTQVDRVIPIYAKFIEAFPTFADLAAAGTADVVRAWRGLGYNLRAVRLKRIAEEVERCHHGSLPLETQALLALPGIGEYTAAAVRVFAFERDDVAVDANVRRVVHRILRGPEFPAALSDAELREGAFAMTPPGRAHDWNSALMDLGARICTSRAPACGRCPVRKDCVAAPLEEAKLRVLRSRHRRARSPEERIAFPLSRRFARGRIVDRLRALPQGQRISLLDLRVQLRDVLSGTSLDLVEPLVMQLERDGIVQRDGDRVALRD
ncbi:MAG: A/G-specific adenine glycosylase [Candidatus Eremiobacteraeota bacterium]|nr:A/G-specific adenine glycosylase [Candidatus Eremiobacteraeota bacterium]